MLFSTKVCYRLFTLIHICFSSYIYFSFYISFYFYFCFSFSFSFLLISIRYYCTTEVINIIYRYWDHLWLIFYSSFFKFYIICKWMFLSEGFHELRKSRIFSYFIFCNVFNHLFHIISYVSAILKTNQNAIKMSFIRN